MIWCDSLSSTNCKSYEYSQPGKEERNSEQLLRCTWTGLDICWPVSVWYAWSNNVHCHSLIWPLINTVFKVMNVTKISGFEDFFAIDVISSWVWSAKRVYRTVKDMELFLWFCWIESPSMFNSSVKAAFRDLYKSGLILA